MTIHSSAAFFTPVSSPSSLSWTRPSVPPEAPAGQDAWLPSARLRTSPDPAGLTALQQEIDVLARRQASPASPAPLAAALPPVSVPPAPVASPKTPADFPFTPGLSGGEALLKAAEKFEGQPYMWGGGHGGDMQGVGGVDCSGLVVQALYDIGKQPPADTTAAGLQNAATPTGMDELKPGDLVFVGKPARHVGIYQGGGKVLHALQPGMPVQVDDLKTIGFDGAGRLPGIR